MREEDRWERMADEMGNGSKAERLACSWVQRCSLQEDDGLPELPFARDTFRYFYGAPQGALAPPVAAGNDPGQVAESTFVAQLLSVFALGPEHELVASASQRFPAHFTPHGWGGEGPVQVRWRRCLAGLNVGRARRIAAV